MVGLAQLGDTAWAVEQALNRWLQLDWPVTPALLALVAEGHRVFSTWVAQLEHGEAGWRRHRRPDRRGQALHEVAEPVQTPASPRHRTAPPAPRADRGVCSGDGRPSALRPRADAHRQRGLPARRRDRRSAAASARRAGRDLRQPSPRGRRIRRGPDRVHRAARRGRSDPARSASSSSPRRPARHGSTRRPRASRRRRGGRAAGQPAAGEPDAHLVPATPCASATARSRATLHELYCSEVGPAPRLHWKQELRALHAGERPPSTRGDPRRPHPRRHLGHRPRSEAAHRLGRALEHRLERLADTGQAPGMRAS